MVQELKIKKQNLYSFFSILFYKIILDISYYFVISKVFTHMKFELNLNVIKSVESYFLLLIVFILMPRSPKKLSNIMVWLLILFSYVPMLTLFAFMNQPRAYMYVVTGFWILVFLLLKSPAVSFTPLKKIQSKIICYSILMGLSGIVFFLICKYFGIHFNFDLTKVYDIRAQYFEMKIPLAGYLFTWLAYVINPIFFALFLSKKKWLPIVLIVVLQLSLFSATGNKTFLFALPFVFALMWVANRKNPLMWISIGLAGLVLLGMLFYWLIGDIWFSYLFTERALLIPAQLSFFYYDFFSKHKFTFLSQHRIFRNFIDYPYHLDPPHLIGEVYFNRPEMGANNGIYADAYMNFGFIGLVLWGMLLVIILKLIDSFSKNKDMKITIAAIAMPVISLINVALLTNLLTEGLLLVLLLLYLLPKSKE